MPAPDKEPDFFASFLAFAIGCFPLLLIIRPREWWSANNLPKGPLCVSPIV
jgi:hypothetical protein